MKRHPALRALSTDHHHGLVQARRLIQAGTAGPAEAPAALAVAQAFLAFWMEETRLHFRAEEEVLLPAFARYGDPAQAPIIRLLVEHVRIRQLVAALQEQTVAGAPTPTTMEMLGTLLRDHIRYEEDVVFPLLERTMPEEALAALPGVLAAVAGA